MILLMSRLTLKFADLIEGEGFEFWTVVRSAANLTVRIPTQIEQTKTRCGEPRQGAAMRAPTDTVVRSAWFGAGLTVTNSR